MQTAIGSVCLLVLSKAVLSIEFIGMTVIGVVLVLVGDVSTSRSVFCPLPVVVVTVDVTVKYVDDIVGVVVSFRPVGLAVSLLVLLQVALLILIVKVCRFSL